MSDRSVCNIFPLDGQQMYAPLKSWMDQFPWLIAGITTRHGGYSRSPYSSLNCGMHVGDLTQDVINNRTIVAERLGIPFEKWTCANQVHGTNVCEVTAQNTGKGRLSMEDAIQDVDALFTRDANILLSTYYADCVPLYFLDPFNKIIGMAHAGWKGTVGRIGVKLVQEWVNRYQSRPEHIRVAIGPSISSCCYEVDDHVIHHVEEHQSLLTDQTIQEKGSGKYMLDLKQANVDFLVHAGIRAKHIEVSQWCTSCHTQHFYSHRKENGNTGRMAAYMAIKNKEE